MRLHGRVLTRPRMLVAGAVVLIGGHGVLYYALSNMTVPVVVVSVRPAAITALSLPENRAQLHHA